MLELKSIKKDYEVNGTPFPALKDVSLTFPDKGLVSILGPSGCGKTTMLNIIGGLDHYTSGDLLIDGKSTKDFNDRDWDGYRNERVGFVFQSYNLIPHMSVIGNVEVSLLLNGVPREERIKRAMEALEKVGLKDEAHKNPNQLSGGQMQRVALARALVNNPKIILADEPTGALDSVTSVQVLDLLKDVSKDRLVIMVTHNRELAQRYSDRIVEMFDGRITSDNAPLENKGGAPIGKETPKKTSMSFLTALKSSAENINTKKTRTILTAVASSFGIIGVALVLAVSNGFSNYVTNVEGSVASSLPIVISPVVMNYLSNNTDDSTTIYPDDDTLHVYDSSSSAYIVHRNNYTQDYIDSVVKPLVTDGLARSYLVNRQGLAFNVLTQVGLDSTSSSYMEVSQYSSAGVSGSVLASVASLPATVFHELYGEEEGLKNMYDLIYGSYPKNPEDLVLITNRYNQVELSTLRRLGIVSSDDDTTKKISFAEILANKTYKAYPNSSFYQDAPKTYKENVYSVNDVDTSHYASDGSVEIKGTAQSKEFTAYTRVNRDSASYGQLYNSTREHKDLHIVGVLRPSPESYINLMPSSIGYLSSLKDEFVADTVSARGKAIGDAASSAWWISSDKDSSNNNMTGLDKLNKAVNTLVSAFKDGSSTSISTNDAESLAKALSYGYFNLTDSDVNRTALTGASYSGYLSASYSIGNDFRESKVADLITRLSSKDKDVSSKAGSEFANLLLSPSFYQAAHTGEDDFNLVDVIAYFESYSLITSILIFPASLTTKDKLNARLDAYNSGKEDSAQILYTDLLSTFTNSLSTLIEVISTVLIVFASISLVVSSVMTGIITYVSVIERTKEIGILRACGARKIDITVLFEAECAIIGGAAGLFGVGITWIACFPINQIIDHQYPGNNLSSIATLNPWHALGLFVISIALAMISGLIPALLAAKKDPVVCLRSE